ncbi:MAG: hypothetical protein A2Z20_01480 [Bdellovibrionales bacterium RBG_16_40_8]|nr:MAG: hypothetical protein A2Z20_01480 [Bdellovibrionales bacterium RBG_16_40_8]
MKSKFFSKALYINFLTISAVLGIVCPGAWAQYEDYTHPGYLFDVTDERYEVTREVVIVAPIVKEEVIFVDQIFTEKMNKEFSKEFRNRFGHTEFEQLTFTSDRFVESADSGRFLPTNEYVIKQENFGLYMGKELAEYHVDNYLKSNRATRSVYKVKEAISNIEVVTNAGYKFKVRYKISSNRVTFRAVKPDERLHKQIDIKLNGEEPTVRLAYDVTKTVAVATDYAVNEEILSVRGEKKLTPKLTTSVTGQSYNKKVGNMQKQERVLLGLSWND